LAFLFFVDGCAEGRRWTIDVLRSNPPGDVSGEVTRKSGERGGTNGPQAGATSSLPRTSHLLACFYEPKIDIQLSFVSVKGKGGRRWEKRPADVFR